MPIDGRHFTPAPIVRIGETEFEVETFYLDDLEAFNMRQNANYRVFLLFIQS